MSCFIVASETINRIVSYVTSHHPGEHYAENDARALLSAANTYRQAHDADAKLAAALFAMNTAAYATCYAGRYPEDRAAAHTYQFTPTDSLPQLVKNMACLLYQCTEGEDIERWPLYVALDKLEKRLGSYIVSTLPEYQAAPWQ